MMNAASKAGYNKEQIEAETGRPLGGAAADPTRAAGAAAGPARVSSQSDYTRLPPGAEYIAPDGSIRRKP
jgi:hypothetical protein